MPVNQNRPFERHMVSNIPHLLQAGEPLSALGVGQLGIFDAKTNLSVTAPTYQNNKAIYIAQGTPDRSGFPEGAGVPNIYRKSHVIEGKKLISLRGTKASRGRGEIVTLGFDGSDASKTLTAKPGDTFYYYIRLTGEPIFNLNPDRSKGVIITGAVSMPCASDCSDNCTTVDCNTIADLVINDLVPHPDPANPTKIVGGKFLPGGQRLTDYVRVSKVSTCDLPTPNVCFKTATINVVDNGTQSDLGVIQSAYPGLAIVRESYINTVSTYSTLVPSGGSAPSNFVQEGMTVVDTCFTCPGGATSNPALDEFQITVPQTTAVDHSSTYVAALSAFTNVSVSQLQYDVLTGVATYTVKVTAGTANAGSIQAALTSSGVTSTVFVGSIPASCTLASTTYSWTVSDCNTVCNYTGTYTLTLKDKICGPCEGSPTPSDVDYEAEITAMYVNSGLATSLTVSNPAGPNCTRLYTLTVVSQNMAVGCTTESVIFPIVPAFNEQEWKFVGVVGASGQSCSCGIQLESHFVPRLEHEATFGYFVRQYDWVHIEISSHNPDWRSTDLCQNDPIATRIQDGAYPNGDGSAVVRIEKADRMYDMDYFYLAPNLREGFDFYFEAKFDAYYDMVAVEYEFAYSSNAAFGQYDRDRYIQFIWLPEGTTNVSLTPALNTYAASANINIDPVVL